MGSDIALRYWFTGLFVWFFALVELMFLYKYLSNAMYFSQSKCDSFVISTRVDNIYLCWQPTTNSEQHRVCTHCAFSFSFSFSHYHVNISILKSYISLYKKVSKVLVWSIHTCHNTDKMNFYCFRSLESVVQITYLWYCHKIEYAFVCPFAFSSSYAITKRSLELK